MNGDWVVQQFSVKLTIGASIASRRVRHFDLRAVQTTRHCTDLNRKATVSVCLYAFQTVDHQLTDRYLQLKCHFTGHRARLSNLSLLRSQGRNMSVTLYSIWLVYSLQRRRLRSDLNHLIETYKIVTGKEKKLNLNNNYSRKQQLQ